MSNVTTDKIRVLREITKEALSGLRQTVEKIGFPESESVQLKYTDNPLDRSSEIVENGRDSVYHDNIKVVESDSDDFSFSFDQDREQVVVVLSGFWVMHHQLSIRGLGPSDTIRLPLDIPTDKVMTTSEPGAKFVYVQFKA